MKLGRLTPQTGVTDDKGRPSSLFQRFWDGVCKGIEAPAAVTDAPASATAQGSPGQIAYDATHFYVCIAENVWVRGTLATW